MKTYKAASTNQNKGRFTHGSFKNAGQKAGTGQKAKSRIGSQKGASSAKEKLAAKDPAHKKLRNISKAMFFSTKPTDSAAMKAQLNA